MRTSPVLAGVLVGIFMAGVGHAAKTNYVSLAGTSVAPPYTSWELATTNIQDAINDAVAGDTVLVSNGTYWINSEVLIDKAITVKGVAGAAETQVVRATLGTNSPQHRIFKITAAATLDGFTVRNGYLLKTPGLDAASQGGGIYVTAGTVQNCVIYTNAVESFWASRGGGIWMGAGSILRFSTVISNSCPDQGSGGGVFGGSTALLISNTIAYNTGDGAALNNSPTARFCVFENNAGSGVYGYGVTLSNCVIRFNRGSQGGGVNCVNANNIFDCTIVSNSASSLGGGLYLNNYYGLCDIQRCVISGNSNATYPGIYDKGWFNADTPRPSTVIQNCLITDNVGANAFYLDGGGHPVTIQNSTIASSGGGGFGVNIRNVSSYTPLVQNTIVYGHATNIYSTNATVLATLLAGAFTNSCSPQLTAPGLNNVTADPVFAKPSVGNYRLHVSSPCVDAGTTNGLSIYTRDLEGVLWGGTVNMGCYKTLFVPQGTRVTVH